MASGSRRRRLAGCTIALATFGVLLIGGCTSDDDPDPSPTPTTVDAAASSTATATTESTAEPTPAVLLPHEDLLPRWVTYGIPSWQLTDAVLTNQDPGRYVAGENGRITPQTYLILDFELANENVGINIASNGARLHLTLADGATVDGKNEQSTSIPAASSAKARYSFEVPAETTFDGLFVTIGDPGRVPSVALPLTGDAPEVEAPAVSATDLAATVPLPGIEMTWTINRQWLGADWPLPFGFRGGATMATTRAEDGTLWLGIEVEVLVAACDCRGGVLDQAATVRLLIDGSPVSPEGRDSSRELMNAQTSSDVMLVFAIPNDTETAVLQIGTLDDPDEQVSIELKIQEPDGN